MTWPPSWKCFSFRKPLTCARMVTSSSARVVPIGLTRIGTVIRRDATTTTRGGAGCPTGSRLALHPTTPSPTPMDEPQRTARRRASGQDERVDHFMDVVSRQADSDSERAWGCHTL